MRSPVPPFLIGMQLATFMHRAGRGWSVEGFPDLDSPQTCVLVFGGAGYRARPEVFAELVRAYPRSLVLGCSTGGEIHGARIFDDTLSIAVVRFDRSAVRMAHASIEAGSTSARVGQDLARALNAPDLRALFVLSDGIVVNGTELLRGIHEVVAADVAVTGGLAGDGDRFQQTWVLAGAETARARVVVLGLYGDAVRVDYGSRGGWDAFGPERIVTRSDGNVLHELDGEPALALYKAYLGDRAHGLPATALLFPLALRVVGGANRLVRSILSVDEEKQTMTFAGDVPEESVVQLMRANMDRIIDAASEASRSARGPEVGPALTIAISCIGRRIVLGERVEEELEAAFEGVPPGGELVGFYSYGEIAPLAGGERSVLHNQTMTVTRLWEA